MFYYDKLRKDLRANGFKVSSKSGKTCRKFFVKNLEFSQTKNEGIMYYLETENPKMYPVVDYYIHDKDIYLFIIKEGQIVRRIY